MPLFDRYLIVDWSAANAPTTGKDSIWTALADGGGRSVTVLNHATRSIAMSYLEECISEALLAGKRLFAGFDFAFGFPYGAEQLPGQGQWEAVWTWLAAQVEDDDDNRSNRFEVAGCLNGLFENGGPFWGHPHAHTGRYRDLSALKPDYSTIAVPEKRGIDALVATAQPVWKLAYTGSVGSQSLLGIARLEALRQGRFGKHIAVWPFETRFAEDISKPVTLAEVYPSLFEIVPDDGEVKDAAQVRVLAEGFERLDAEGAFSPLLDGPSDARTRSRALSHEAWMVGFSDERLGLPQPGDLAA